MLDPLPLKVLFGFVAVLLLLGAVYIFLGAPNPMFSGSLGPGWECDVGTRGATICARDVKPPIQTKKSGNPETQTAKQQ
jgi:hypothetical protein